MNKPAPAFNNRVCDAPIFGFVVGVASSVVKTMAKKETDLFFRKQYKKDCPQRQITC